MDRPNRNQDTQGEDSDTTTESQSEIIHKLDTVRNRNSGRESDRERNIGLLHDDGREKLQYSGDVRELLLDISREMRYMNRNFTIWKVPCPL